MKCLVKDCTNQSHEGHFINNLCYSCYQYITTGSGNSVLHRDAEEAAMFHYKRGFQDAKEIQEHDRYELEQAIMSCWGITDDLHLLADAMESGEHKRMHHEMLLNLSQLYELKFQKLFKEFEKFTGCYL